MLSAKKVIDRDGEYFLLPGNIFVSAEQVWVTTILGSCISVCLWDRVKKIGGINHFLLPFWNGRGLASPKYGNIAIERLVERMIAQGSDLKHLRAKVFGGAKILHNGSADESIGLRNIALAKSYLESKAIAVIAFDVGGRLARKIRFNTLTGDVLVKKMRPMKTN